MFKIQEVLVILGYLLRHDVNVTVKYVHVSHAVNLFQTILTFFEEEEIKFMTVAQFVIILTNDIE